MRAARRACLVVLGVTLALLAGCASAPQTRALLAATDLPLQAALPNTPFYPQDAYQCGPAALAMLLVASGVTTTPEVLVDEVYVPARQGSFQVEMQAAARRHDRLALRIQPRMHSLLAWLDGGEPVLVLQNLGPDWYPVWHYAVVIGYDLESREMLLRSGVTPDHRVSMSTFERTWARAAFWGMVTLAPGELPYRDSSADYFVAAAALEETNTAVDMLAVWRTGVAAWPDEPDIALGLANQFYRRGEYQSALAGYSGLVADFPHYLPGYNNLASLLGELGRREAAIATASEGLRRAGGRNPALEATLAQLRESPAEH